MSQLIVREIEKALEHPSRKELLAAIREQGSLQLEPSPAEVLLEERPQR